jgi:hypothetical protein
VKVNGVINNQHHQPLEGYEAAWRVTRWRESQALQRMWGRIIKVIVLALAIAALIVVSSHAVTCRTEPGKGPYRWKMIDDRTCWYKGRKRLAAEELAWPAPPITSGRTMRDTLQSMYEDCVHEGGDRCETLRPDNWPDNNQYLDDFVKKLRGE